MQDDHLLAEEARLVAEIEAQQKRLADLREYIRLRAQFSDLEKPRPAAGVLGHLTETLRSPKITGGTLRERILVGCELILEDGKRRLSRELVPELAELGVDVTGKDLAAKASNLSAYLSREKKLFSSDVKMGGWTLLKLARADAERPADVGASAGLFSNNGFSGRAG